MHTVYFCATKGYNALNYSSGFSNSSIIPEFIVSPQLSVVEVMTTVAAGPMKSQRSVGHKGTLAEEPDKMVGSK